VNQKKKKKKKKKKKNNNNEAFSVYRGGGGALTGPLPSDTVAVPRSAAEVEGTAA
jgi:hypothetical protein